LQRTPGTRHTSSASSARGVGAERSCQGPFLGDRGLNSAGTFASAIAGSNLLAAPWSWRHGLMDERPPLGASGEPWHAGDRSFDDERLLVAEVPRRLRLPLASRKESSTLSGTRPAWRHHVAYALAMSRRAGAASELPDLARAHSARSEKIEFSRRNLLLQRALPRRAVGHGFSGGPAKLLPHRSSAADAVVRPNGGARVQRITLTAVSAFTPGRQGVR